VSAFSPGEGRWRARQGTLRQAVRQELVTRQLAGHLPDAAGLSVLDLGCGQGTQLLALARGGHRVTGLDASAALLADLRTALAAEPAEVRERVRIVEGDVREAGSLPAPARFDVVLCHGVLMYLPDPGPVLDVVAEVTAPNGLVSLLVRNGDALAMRPGLQGDWAAAADAFDGTSYRNRIGVDARADRLADLTAALAERGVSRLAWYGVRVFTDTAADDEPLPDRPRLDALMACEERAGRTDPYRGVAALLHVIARRESWRPDARRSR
jgi:S-adenosylmethionine-dependent methyltransferase